MTETEGDTPGEEEPVAAPAMTPQRVRDATLSLRRPTVVDALQSAVPVPEAAVPANGLPYWRRVPLGSRLPIIDHPKDAFVFYRDKLSRGLWQARPPPGHFRLDDPYMHEVDYTYEPVHDPALRRMFEAGEHRRTLLERGFILPTGEAVCSLRQFNTFRRYLQTVYRELISEEYRRRAVDLSDEQAIRRARQCEERQLEQDERRMAREEKQGEQRANLEEMRRQKNQQLMARQLRYAELLERVEARKEEQRQLAVERAREMDEKVKHRQAVATEIQRAKVIATIRAWNREERERKERLEKQQLQLQEYKEKEVARQWQSKVQVQTEREEREARLLARQEEALKLAVELRNKKLEREDLRMQALLQKIKTDQEQQRAKRFRFRPAKRKRPGRPSKTGAGSSAREENGESNPKRRRRVASTGFIADDETMTPLDHMFNMSLRMVKSGREQGQASKTGNDMWKQFRATGFDPSETRDGVPEAVATALDGLFDAVMEGIVHRMVMQTLKCVYHKVLERCFSLLEDLPVREMARRGWVCQHGMMKHSELRERARARGARECRSAEAESAVGEATPGRGSDPGPSPGPSPGPRRTRSPHRQPPDRRTSEEERQRILRQIEAIERKNQQLRKALEQGVGSAVSVGSAEDDEREAALDLDANFEVMAKSLQRKMVAIAAQSVSEETKVTTQHRWKIMKEVELFELVDRLCSMMMNLTPKKFLKSTEFHWAADILARDVMKEVRTQVRQNNRKKERELVRRAKQAGMASRRSTVQQGQATPRPRKEAPGLGPGPGRRRSSRQHDDAVELQGVAPGPGHQDTSETSTSAASSVPLDESKVPLLRLHKRSPHQPSIPSLETLL